MRLRRGRCVAAVALGLASALFLDDVPASADTVYEPYISWNAYETYLSPALQPGNGACGVDESTQARTAALAATSSAYQDGYYYPSPAMQANLGARGYRVRVGSGDYLANRNSSNAGGAHRHIPVHTNAHVGTIVCSRTDAANSGTQVYYSTGRTTGQNLVNQLKDTVGVKSPGTGDKVVTNTSWAELNSVTAPAAYLESEFHTWQRGADWIKTSTVMWGGVWPTPSTFTSAIREVRTRT